MIQIQRTERGNFTRGIWKKRCEKKVIENGKQKENIEYMNNRSSQRRKTKQWNRSNIQNSNFPETKENLYPCIERAHQVHKEIDIA